MTGGAVSVLAASSGDPQKRMQVRAASRDRNLIETVLQNELPPHNCNKHAECESDYERQHHPHQKHLTDAPS